MLETVPEPYASIIDDICKQDKVYFELNPLATSYRRPYCPGEFYPVQVDPYKVDYVEVTKLTDSARTRSPHIKLPKYPKINSARLYLR